MSQPIPTLISPPVLNTTAKITHTTRLPASTTRPQALAMLSDHVFFLHCDPHLARYEPIPPSEHATLTPPPSIPDDIKPRLRRLLPPPTTPPQPQPSSHHESEAAEVVGGGEEATATVTAPTCYRVTDVVHAIPAGIWDTNVVSVYEFADLAEGVFVRIRSPLGVVMETVWRVADVEGGSSKNGVGLELVEEVTVRCSRLLLGIVKGACETNWRGIHGKMVERLEKEAKGEGV